MRFIGSKATLLDNIDMVISENTNGTENTFCDIFSGTAAVAQHFKPH
ncbi:MAG: DNA adenine methylase, partial [Oscillospiraceae bacterium]